MSVRASDDWQLVEWDPDFFKGKAPEKPVKGAELTGGGAWCALFHERRPVATWYSPTHSRGESSKT